MPIQPGEPVYFLSLEMKNVGAFGPEGVRIDLSDGHGRPAMWTLILGENGVGKTTALECLLALTPWAVEDFPVDGARIYAQQWMIDDTYDRRAHANATLPLRIAATIRQSRLPSPSSQSSEIEFQIEPFASGGERSAVHAHSPFSSTDNWPDSPVVSYHARRDLGLTYPDPDGRESYVSRGRPDKAFRVVRTKDVDAWLSELHHTQLARAQREMDGDFDKVTGLLVDVLPNVDGIRATVPQERGDTVRIEYLTLGVWMPFQRLALGYQSIVRLIGDLAYRMYSAYPESAEPLKEAAVVLIDEIDLHLHPTWQRKIIGTLSERFPNVQFIATAHSPLMVQAAAGHNLVLLKRNPETKQVVVENDVDGIAKWRLDQIVTSKLFGVPSAVRPQLDEGIERRDALLAKETLTDADRDEIRSIEAQLGDVPLGETEETRGMNDLLRRTLEALEKKAAG